MSQIIGKDIAGNTVLFGLDHAIGWFISILDRQDEPFLDRSQMFDRMNKSQLVELLQQHLTAEEQVRLRPQIHAIVMDLDPGEA